MRKSMWGPKAGRRGTVLVLVAVSMVALLSMMALAIDAGMLYDTKQDAQRAADAAALAGASKFLLSSGTAAIPGARDEALKNAAKNFVRGVKIDTAGAATGSTGVTTYTANEAVITVFPTTARVRVRIRRAAVTTWFAKMFGVNSIPIASWATAEASAAGGATCVRPWALPDYWKETSPQDANGNRIWDGPEKWVYQPPSDTYGPYDPTNPQSGTATGYGSDWRNGNGVYDDFGRGLVLKPQDPQDIVGGPSFFNVWEVGGVHYNANEYQNAIENCTPGETYLGVPYGVKPGNMVGPTKKGVQNLVAQDPGATWVPPVYVGSTLQSGGYVTGSNQTNWVDSPRVIKVALYDPVQLANIQARATITFNNIALFFLEGIVGSGNQAAVQGRFLYYAKGSSGGPVTGPLVKLLRLVE